MSKLHKTIKHPAVTIPLATFTALLMVSVLAIVAFSGGTPKLQASNTRTVIVSYDNQEQTIPTRADSVGELLKRLNIQLGEGDVVEPAQDAQIVTDNFRVNVYRAKPITIVDSGHKVFTFSAAATPRSVVKQAGIEVYPEDILENIPTKNFLLEGSIGPRVVINRATPVHVNIYGTQVTMRTHAKTIGELLDERNINLGKDENVTPGRETPIAKDMQIFLLQKGAQLTQLEEEIAMPVEEIEDKNLSFGTTAVRQEGTPGKKIVTYIIEFKDGQEVGRRQIQSIVVQEPVKQIIARGTYVDIPTDHAAIMAAAGISPGDFEYADYIIANESGWRPGALNASGCAGLGQACPGSKLAQACSNWQVDPVCQMRYFNGYAVGRYGTWAAAYDFKKSRGWW